MNEAEGYLMMAQDYLEKFNFKSPENTRLATTTLKSMNSDLVADIEQHQAYEVADSYTVVKDLTQEPVLVTMGSCSVAPIFGWEGRAIGLASMKSQAYEDFFRSGEAGIDAFKSVDLIKNQINKALGVEKGTAAKIDEKMEDRSQKNDIGTAMLANSASIPYIITWEGRAKIPESTVGFGELFSAILKDGEKGEYLAETLRFQLLWYLRALTCRSEMQPKDASPSKIIQTVHKPKQIPSTIRLRVLPREPISRAGSVPEKSELPSLDETGEKRKSPVEHKRRLPPGFYATPASVMKAQQHGIQLAQEAQEDGSIRYIETFVAPRKQEGDNPKVQTIQARLRESAIEALGKSTERA